MNLLANDYPEVILTQPKEPCLSLYQPTHRQHPENLQDPMRFGNLVKQLTHSVQKKYPQRDTAALLAPLHALAKDTQFWNKSLDGLAILASGKSAKAAVTGRIHTLLLEAEHQVPGRMDAITGAITPGEMDDPEVDDLLDDLGERGEVVMVPKERMPPRTGLAAIYRY